MGPTGRLLKWAWVVLAVWPALMLFIFWCASFVIVIADMAIFGLEGGPLSSAVNWVYDVRLWWGGPGAGVAGELGVPALAAIVLCQLITNKAHRRQEGRNAAVSAIGCLLVIGLFTGACILGAAPNAVGYAGLWFRFENIIGEPELHRSPSMALYAASRWSALLITPAVLPLFQQGSGAGSPRQREQAEAYRSPR